MKEVIETFIYWLAMVKDFNTYLNFFPQTVFIILLAAGLAYVVGQVYIKYGTSLSNRRVFANNFLLLASTTALIIMIIKASIALSLGLVGALSIVRFRAAIKEPEEIVYLFIMIGIGIGMGAGEIIVTVSSVLVIITIIIVRALRSKDKQSDNYNVNIISSRAKSEGMQSLFQILSQNSRRVSLKRFDEDRDTLDMVLLIELDDIDALQILRSNLLEYDDGIKISFVDNQGLL